MADYMRRQRKKIALIINGKALKINANEALKINKIALKINDSDFEMLKFNDYALKINASVLKINAASEADNSRISSVSSHNSALAAGRGGRGGGVCTQRTSPSSNVNSMQYYSKEKNENSQKISKKEIHEMLEEKARRYFCLFDKSQRTHFKEFTRQYSLIQNSMKTVGEFMGIIQYFEKFVWKELKPNAFSFLESEAWNDISQAAWEEIGRLSKRNEELARQRYEAIYGGKNGL